MRKLLGIVFLACASLHAGVAFAQGVTGVGTLVSNDPLSMYLDKGGVVVMAAVLLYFYRTVIESSREQSQILIRIVETSTRAQTESSLAVIANTAMLQRILDRIDNPKAKTA